jgi:hypothetical protein
MVDEKTAKLKQDLEKQRELKKKEEEDLKNQNWSSGIESDNDLDLLVE